MSQARKAIPIQRWSSGELADVQDEVSVEEPLEIRLGYFDKGSRQRSNVSVTMRTPGHDEDLALGFLFTENIIYSMDQVEVVRRIDPGFRNTQRDNLIQVDLQPGYQPPMDLLSRNFYTTSSCGVCGKTSIDLVQSLVETRFLASNFQVTTSYLKRLPAALSKAQSEFNSTGAIHGAALFNSEGEVVVLREDVGRHNALDKLIGHAFQSATLPLDQQVLLLSGRASFELIQKASMAGIQVVAAIGAPSTLAVELAEESGITLIGFLRENRMNIYSGMERIMAD